MRRAKETAFLGKELARILDEKSEEKLTVFTGHPETKELCAQINRLLEDRQQRNAEFKRKEARITQMLSNISHDIRTPMTVILGYLEILRPGNEAEESLAKVEKKAAQVMELMEQFFALSRLEAGEEQLVVRPFEVCEACRECVLDFYELLTKQKFQVEVSVPEEEMMILGEEAAFRRILLNLISNGIRYGGDGKYLGFFLDTEPPFVRIQVKDRGKGMEPETLSRVFERLYMEETVKDQNAYGTGLGLSIAKKLAERMGGSLSVSSRPHMETCFTLKLPLADERNL